MGGHAQQQGKKILIKYWKNSISDAGDIIADIGSGGGFFTFNMARRTGPGGRVIAADTNEGLLSRIENIASKNQVSNIKTVLCSEEGCPLQKESCGLVFMRDVFHHNRNPPAKPGGSYYAP